MRLGDVAHITDSVEDVRAAGLYDLKPSVLLIIFRQPGANIIETVDRIRDAIPQLKSEIPAGIDINVVVDRSSTIRASVRDVEMTLVLSIGLVILVVFLFLRNGRATFIPSVAVPVSLIGTFGVMYLCGYSVDNLSLMGLTISTGFVVDDAIVVIENINRHLEAGMRPDAGGPPRRAGNRLYGLVDQHFAGGRLYSDSDDGRASSGGSSASSPSRSASPLPCRSSSRSRRRP